MVALRRGVRWKSRAASLLVPCLLSSGLQLVEAFVASRGAPLPPVSHVVNRCIRLPVPPAAATSPSSSSSSPPPPPQRRRRQQQSSASSTGNKRLTPAEELQYASSPEDILSCAAQYASSGSLKPAHLSQAVLRVGRALVQPKDAERREAMRKDRRLEEVLSAWQASSAATARQHSDLLLGLALLDYKPPPPDVVAGTIKALQGSSQGRGQHQLTGEDVSNVAWSLERLGVPQLLPEELRAATEGLPFRVLQGALADERLEVAPFMEEVQWRQDTIQVAGKEVEETRLTAWQGPRPFFYSGKEMGPAPMTATVARVRDVLKEKTGLIFDCVLLNLYLHGKVAMSWHIDPDQDVLWQRSTAVVSIGDSRYFMLRRIDDHNQRHRFLVNGGDVVLMLDDCQFVYQHCVRKEESSEEAGPRISLVFKQSLHDKDP